MKDDFECLRCGNCCDTYALELPNGKRKEPFTPCEYLRDIICKKGKLTLAGCQLHGTEQQPDICNKTFRERSVLSDLQGPCKIGRIEWSKNSIKYGMHRMPERIQEILLRKKRNP